MKIHRWLINLRISAVALLCGITLFTSIYPISRGMCDLNIGDDLISLRVQNKLLGDVLQTISEMTDYIFVIDGIWEDLPVSTSFQNLTLHHGLKRILKDLNNAIIYSSDREITIVIYGKSKSTRRTISYDRKATNNHLRENASAVHSSPLAESNAPVPEPPNQPADSREQESSEMYSEPAAEESEPAVDLPSTETQSTADDGISGEEPGPPVPYVPDTDSAVGGTQPEIDPRQEP